MAFPTVIFQTLLLFQLIGTVAILGKLEVLFGQGNPSANEDQVQVTKVLMNSASAVPISKSGGQGFEAKVESNMTEDSGQGIHTKAEEKNILTQNMISGNPSINCSLEVDKNDAKNFVQLVLKNEWNLVALELSVTNATINGTQNVIQPNIWIWTYKGENGGYIFLHLPVGYDIWSAGLLAVHSPRTYFTLNLHFLCNPQELIVGQAEYDKMISHALNNMTEAMKNIADPKETYDHSYWCYRQYINESKANKNFCKYMICPVKFIRLSCCLLKKVDDTKKKYIDCHFKDYYYDSLWWNIPYYLGIILFLFFPPLLLEVLQKLYGIHSRDRRLTDAVNQEILENIETVEGSPQEMPSLSSDLEVDLDNITFVNETWPVSLTSVLCKPFLFVCRSNRVVASRIIRILFPLLTLVFVALQVCLEIMYHHPYITESVKKGVPMDFLSMVAGYEQSRDNFLPVFGGPIIAIVLYVVTTALYTCMPRDLSIFLLKYTRHNESIPISVLFLDMKTIERFCCKKIEKERGYIKLRKLLIGRVLTLINKQFWKTWYIIGRQRWIVGIYGKIRHHRCFIPKAIIIGCLYCFVCMLELILTVLFYGIPTIGFFCILIKTYYCGCRDGIRSFNSGRLIPKFIVAAIAIMVSVCVLYPWYILCLIFIDTFHFFCRLCLFTYIGIFVYPKQSYGYLILTFVAIYYLYDGFASFGSRYRTILKVTVDICENLKRKSSDTTKHFVYEYDGLKGIPTPLLNFIVERTKPQGIEVCKTLARFAITLFVLAVSLILLLSFDRFQDLGIIVNIFSILFICCLPKILKLMCSNSNYELSNQRFRKKIKKSILEYRKQKLYGNVDQEDYCISDEINANFGRISW